MTLALISCMRNEGPFLLEWIAHHRAMGVGRFVIYSNDCDDGTDKMLDSLQDHGIVDHFSQDRRDGKSLQWQAFKDASSHGRLTDATWVAALDCDEFLNPLGPLSSVTELLAEAGDADAIAIPWRLFGNSGIVDFQDRPVTELFTKAAPVPCHYPVAASFFKTIYRNDGPFSMPGIHRPKQDGVPRFAGPDLRPLPDAIVQNQSRIQAYGLRFSDARIQLNHYSLRSAASFMVKRDRGLPNRATRAIGTDYWVERNFNTVSDKSIQRHGGGLARELAALLALPGMQSLHDTACQWHENRFNSLMQDPENAQFFGRLVLAGGSVDPGPNVARRLIQAFQAAQKTPPVERARDV